MHRRLGPLACLFLLPACASTLPASTEGTATTEWRIGAAPDRVQAALVATRDSVGFGPARVADAEASLATGRPVYRLSGRNGFGTVTAVIEADGADATRVRLQMVYPLPFTRETPMMHLRWIWEAVEALGETTTSSSVPAAVVPASQSSCETVPAGPVTPATVPPALTTGAEPVYPKEARERRYEGRVHIRAVVNETGRVACADVTSGLPYGLSESALRAVQAWQFRPATLDGRPVAVFVTVPITFRVPR